MLAPNTYDGALFRDEAAGPEGAGRSAEIRGRWLRVIAVGANTITAARVKDGRVFTIERGRKAVARDAPGTKQPWRAFIGGLVTGDLLRVKGKRKRRRGRIRAGVSAFIDLPHLKRMPLLAWR